MATYRYLVFEYEDFYPAGGMFDCTLKTNDVNDIFEKITDPDDRYSNAEIYDVNEDVHYESIEDLRRVLKEESE